MQTVQIKTLVDITKHKNLRPGQGTPTEVDQYKNFTTLLQCIELRSIVSYDANPTVETVDVKGAGFGSKYKGRQQVWTFTVQTDRDDVYLDGDNPVGKLIEDIHSVPVIKSLAETINIDRAVFDCKDSLTKNTLVSLISTSESQ